MADNVVIAIIAASAVVIAAVFVLAGAVFAFVWQKQTAVAIPIGVSL